MFNNINILVVCMANFCRSPVAERLLDNFTNKKIHVGSAGLLNLKKDHMDVRSSKFLISHNIDVNHQTKQITNEILKKSTLIYTFDNILIEKLRANHPLYHSKIKLIGNDIIEDPIKFSSEKYKENMETILKASKHLAAKLNQMY